MVTIERLETWATEIQAELASAGHKTTIAEVRTLMRLSSIRLAYASGNPKLQAAADAYLATFVQGGKKP